MNIVFELWILFKFYNPSVCSNIVVPLHLCVETVLWEDRLQQGHVQQVDPSGQSTRGRPQDIQSCTYSFISTCYHGPLCSVVPGLNKLCVCVVLFWSTGGEHRRPGQREAAAGTERQLLSTGRERKEWTEEEKAALWSVSLQTLWTARVWMCMCLPVGGSRGFVVTARQREAQCN